MNNLDKFKETMETVEDTESAAKLKNKKAYVHPFNNEHYEVNMNPTKASELFFEFVGPEQVSPHYESFLASRKWALGFWGTSLTLAYVGSTVDFHWVARSCIIPFTFYATSFYWILEGRKHIIKPLFSRWYRTLAFHDLSNFQVYYKDMMRINVKKQIATAREQMDYYMVHKNFNAVKAESINRFMAHEQMNLQKHINDRTHSVLRSAKQGEVNNERALVNKVVAKAIEFLDAKMESDMSAINDAMFECALAGISSGKMNYANDPLLPMVQQLIREEVAKITDLSPAEQLRMVALTEAQLGQLRNADETAKKEFLEAMPKFDAMTMGSESYRKMSESWGK